MTASKPIASTDKNGYCITLSKDTYSVIESNYTLTIYDYDEGTTAGIITPATENNLETLKNIYNILKKMEGTFQELQQQLINHAIFNNYYYSVC